MSTEVVTEVASGGLGSLGLNWRIFIAQLVNFAIVLFVLWRWAWKPIVKLLDTRQTRIEKSIADAKRIEEEMARLEAHRASVMKDTEMKAQAIITEALASTEVSRKEVARAAHVEVEKIMRDGQESLRRERAEMIAGARRELATLVITATGKVLEEEMDETRNRTFVQKVLEKL